MLESAAAWGAGCALSCGRLGHRRAFRRPLGGRPGGDLHDDDGRRRTDCGRHGGDGRALRMAPRRYPLAHRDRCRHRNRLDPVLSCRDPRAGVARLAGGGLLPGDRGADLRRPRRPPRTGPLGRDGRHHGRGLAGRTGDADGRRHSAGIRARRGAADDPLLPDRRRDLCCIANRCRPGYRDLWPLADRSDRAPHRLRGAWSDPARAPRTRALPGAGLARAGGPSGSSIPSATCCSTSASTCPMASTQSWPAWVTRW